MTHADEDDNPPASTPRSDRWRSLLTLLAERGTLSVVDAAAELGVSAATVRRDFTSLEQQQLATRTHGGVVATSVAYDLPAHYRSTGGGSAKDRVAQAAAAMVERGMVVGLNGGTTTTVTARAIASRQDLMSPGQESITIVTNALNIASEMVLRPHCRTVCIGGVARRESYELHGPHASRFLDDLRLDLLMLGVHSLNAKDGAMCRYLDEAGINAQMAANARRVIAVGTAEKLTGTALAQICPASSISVFITDDEADPGAVADLTEAGVHVVLV
ncbi:MAG: DeoR/GlpR transcriptional regulator [Nocardioidaceae bacterium]|nr:DeoR/GlpR transcriptional regulator [Nocardioidaceae bacterium]